MRRALLVLLLLGLAVEAFAQAPAPEPFENRASWYSFGSMFRTNLLDRRQELVVIGEGEEAVVALAAEDADATFRPVGEIHLLFPVFEWLEVGPAFIGALGDNVVEEACLGPTFAFKRGGRALGINLSVCANPDSHFPDERFVVGQPPPGGATSVRTFRKTSYTTAITVTFMGVD